MTNLAQILTLFLKSYVNGWNSVKAWFNRILDFYPIKIWLTQIDKNNAKNPNFCNHFRKPSIVSSVVQRIQLTPSIYLYEVGTNGLLQIGTISFEISNKNANSNVSTFIKFLFFKYRNKYLVHQTESHFISVISIGIPWIETTDD